MTTYEHGHTIVMGSEDEQASPANLKNVFALKAVCLGTAWCWFALHCYTVLCVALLGCLKRFTVVYSYW